MTPTVRRLRHLNAFILLGLLSSCGARSESGGDSNSNWIKACDEHAKCGRAEAPSGGVVSGGTGPTEDELAAATGSTGVEFGDAAGGGVGFMEATGALGATDVLGATDALGATDVLGATGDTGPMEPWFESCDGQSVNTLRNETHCGGCDQPCAQGEVCLAGVCSISDCSAPLGSHTTGQDPIAIVIGDWDGDGLGDIATANNLDNTVSVLLSCAGGGFRAMPDLQVRIIPEVIVRDDMNGDGVQDVVVAGLDTVSVLLGAGDGTFPTHLEYARPLKLPAGPEPYFLVTGDMSGDGIADVAVSNSHADKVSVLLGVGDGTLQAGAEYRTMTSSSSLALGDVNGDGVSDLVAAGSAVAVLFGNGDGTFAWAMVWEHMAHIATLGDFTGDGLLDLGVRDTGDRGAQVTLFPGAGDGTFVQGDKLSDESTALVPADLNNDGKTDLVALGNGAVGALLQADGTLTSVGSWPLAGDSLAVGDVNGDGRVDIVTAATDDDKVRVLLAESVGTLGSEDGAGR